MRKRIREVENVALYLMTTLFDTDAFFFCKSCSRQWRLIFFFFLSSLAALRLSVQMLLDADIRSAISVQINVNMDMKKATPMHATYTSQSLFNCQGDSAIMRSRCLVIHHRVNLCLHHDCSWGLLLCDEHLNQLWSSVFCFFGWKSWNQQGEFILL